MSKRAILFAFFAFLMSAGAARPQDQLGIRMMQEHIGDVRPGIYSAGDRLKFSLNHYLDRYLLRFVGDSEIFVLTADHASLGGRVLKYDSGATALQVSGWSAITLYTDAQPSGLPAERTGDAMMPAVTLISLSDMQRAAADESDHLAYARDVHIAILAEWPMLAGDQAIRAFAFDAMQNTSRGIERFARGAAARAALAAKIDTVQLLTSSRPLVTLRGRTLNVAYNPEQGFSGRPSSRAIAQSLSQILAVPNVN
jgi:Domain of unknown function (DUF4908)